MKDDKDVGDVDNGLRATFSERINRFLKDWLVDLVLVAVMLVYVLRSIVQIQSTNKTISEIIGDCVLIFAFMAIIKNLMMRKGIQVGSKSDSYLKAKNCYEENLKQAMLRPQYMIDFVDIFNERNKRSELSRLLARYSLSYDAYVKGIDNPTPIQLEGVKAAKRAKYLRIRVEDLTGNGIEKTGNKRTLGKNLGEFMRSKSIADIAFTMAAVIVFAKYTVSLLNDFSWGALIWTLIQVVAFLAKGAMSFVKSYMFMTEDYTNRTIRQSNLLIEFIKTDSQAFEDYRALTEPKQATQNADTQSTAQEITEEQDNVQDKKELL